MRKRLLTLSGLAFGKPLNLNYKGFPICQANVDPSRAAGIGFLLMTDCRTLQTR